MKVASYALFASMLSCTSVAFTPSVTQTKVVDTSLQAHDSRRVFLQSTASILPLSVILSSSEPASAKTNTPITTASSGDLPDLPPDAVRSYLQYRTPLQISADYYLFDLRDQVSDTQEWGKIGQMFNSMNARGGQGQPSNIERNFINPMRILALSMPPDTAEEMRTAQFEFERAMAKISKATSGVTRDLSVEIPKESLPQAKQGWEEGRLALNHFFTVCNEATGLKGELRQIPAGEGDAQWVAYKRSPRKYNDLMKKTKLCQNRGGPTLSAAWGQLMVSGYMQDSCGIPDMEDYFFQ